MGNTQPTLHQIPKPPTTREQQDLQSEKESENRTEFTCDICIETNIATNKFRNANKCSHPFCTDCMIKYIRSKLEDDNTGDIKCPALDCENVLDPFDCARIIGRPVFLRWCDVLCEAAIVDRDKCYCQNISCNEVILNECGGKPKKMQCPKCKSWFCFQCKIDWHSGFSCDESLQLRDDNDVEFGRLAELNKWGRCPQCSHYCKKMNGCQIVKCRCGIEFCYKCGRRSYGHVCRCAPFVTCCQLCLEICIMIIICLLFLAPFIGFIWLIFCLIRS